MTPPDVPAAMTPAARRWTAAGAAMLAMLLIGCGRDAEIRPGDIRSYTVSRQAEPTPVAGTEEKPSRPASPRLTYDVPPGWTDGGASGMRLATLLMGDPAERNEVTIIPAAGTLQSNVERWQGQLDAAGGAEAIKKAADAAVASAEKIDVDGDPASVVLLLDPTASAASDGGQAILAAMIPVDESTALFVKFKGAAAVARRERDAFLRFVSSIRWKQ